MSEYYAEPEPIEEVGTKLKGGSSAMRASATEIDASRKKIEQSDSLTALGYASLVDNTRRGVSLLAKRENRIASVLDTVSALYVEYESRVINVLEDSTSAGNNYSSASRHQVRDASESHAAAAGATTPTVTGQSTQTGQGSNNETVGYGDVGKWLQETYPELYKQICALLSGNTTSAAAAAAVAGTAGLTGAGAAGIKRGMSTRSGGTAQGSGTTSRGTGAQSGGSTSSGSGSQGGTSGQGTSTSGGTGAGTSGAAASGASGAADAGTSAGTPLAGEAATTGGTDGSGATGGTGAAGIDTSGGGASGVGGADAGSAGGVGGADAGQGSDWASDALNDAIDSDAVQAAQGELAQAASVTNPEATATGSSALSDGASVSLTSDEQSGFSQLLSQWGTGLYDIICTYGIRAGLLAGGAGAAYASSGKAIEAVAHCAEFVSTKCVPGVQGFMNQVSSAAHVTRVNMRTTVGNIVQGVSSLAG